jgi:hypothetical protein
VKKEHPEEANPGTALHLQDDFAETNAAAQRAKETTQPQELTKQRSICKRIGRFVCERLYPSSFWTAIGTLVIAVFTIVIFCG